MDPITMALIGAGIGGLGSLLQPQAKEVMPSLINPEQYQQGLLAANSAYTNNNNLMQSMMGQAGAFQGQGSALLQRYLQQPGAADRYDPMAAQRAFLGGVPQLQNVARETVGDVNTEDLLRQEREMISQQVGDTFGGTVTSGAFGQALGQGMATPLLQRAQAREQTIANLAGSLMGNSQGLLNQNFLQQAMMGQQDTNRLLQGAQFASGQAGQALQGAGLYGQLAGQGFSGLMGLSQPVYATPDYVQQRNPFGDFLGGAAAGAGLGSNMAMLGNNVQPPMSGGPSLSSQFSAYLSNDHFNRTGNRRGL